MKLAIIGSRSVSEISLDEYILWETDEIVSGGAKGVDQCAKAFATAKGLKLTEFLPDYARYGRAAPLRRNEEIVRYADAVLAFWDGVSSGTAFVIRFCEKEGKPVQVIRI